MVVVFGHISGMMLEQGAVVARRDEATPVPTLFTFLERACAVAIINPLNAQSDTAAARSPRREGDDVDTVERDQPRCP